MNLQFTKYYRGKDPDPGIYYQLNSDPAQDCNISIKKNVDISNITYIIYTLLSLVLEYIYEDGSRAFFFKEPGPV